MTQGADQDNKLVLIKIKMRVKKLVVALMFMSLAIQGWAVDNSIYIDQSGDNATITMTQDGTGNRVRGLDAAGTGNTTPATIYGDNVTVTVEQVGSGNVLKLGIDTGTASGGADSSVNYSITGSNSVASISMKNDGAISSLSNVIDITQVSTTGATVSVLMTGTSNTLTSTQTGGSYAALTANISGTNNTATVNQSGGANNSANITQSGDYATASVTTVGASNSVTISQSGGTTGQTATISLTGSSNTASITQQGTADHTTNITGVGSGNSFTIIQRN